MAYEVVKDVKGRRYRYRVESYRDAESGRVRNRWTYLGRIATEGQPKQPRASSSETRQRLHEAFARLLERADWNDVTSGAIAHEAGLAHGTFYRHYVNKEAILRAAFECRRTELERMYHELLAIASSPERERARLDLWVLDLLRARAGTLGLASALRIAAERDVALAALREDSRANAIATIASYLRGLEERGFARLDAGDEAYAAMVFTLLEGVVERMYVLREPPSTSEAAALRVAVRRTIFAA
ncbi:MAG TPA: TetR/AcrR family transcriptional regulator [Candidatus Acidoferrum sp.]|nr:TetR/AcrR family transcriptional regulator [Candidatus Acidoferrum sp.]